MKKTTVQLFHYFSIIVAVVDRLQGVQEVKEIFLTVILRNTTCLYFLALNLMISLCNLRDKAGSNTWFKHHLQLILACEQAPGWV